MAENKKILICESEEILLTALKFRLQKQGYELLLAPDGETAKSLIQSGRPDIIVTDIELPGVSLQELMKHAQTNIPHTAPIILITPLEQEEVVLEAMAQGAADFVTKPFKPVELVLRIRCHLERIGR